MLYKWPHAARWDAEPHNTKQKVVCDVGCRGLTCGALKMTENKWNEGRVSEWEKYKNQRVMRAHYAGSLHGFRSSPPNSFAWRTSYTSIQVSGHTGGHTYTLKRLIWSTFYKTKHCHSYEGQLREYNVCYSVWNLAKKTPLDSHWCGQSNQPPPKSCVSSRVNSSSSSCCSISSSTCVVHTTYYYHYHHEYYYFYYKYYYYYYYYYYYDYYYYYYYYYYY